MSQRQSNRFLYLYALAVAGGAVAYVPFLTILLPNQATNLVGDGAITLLAHTAFAGAVAASVAHIFFGWASDRTGVRQPWIWAGLFISSALLLAMQQVNEAGILVLLFILWQFGLNMMLAPLAALAGDYVPDSQKGLLGGLMAFAPAMGALAGAFVTIPGLADPDDRISVVAGLVLLMVLPVLLFGRPVPMNALMESAPSADDNICAVSRMRSDVVRMWLARLFVQIAEASLFAFLLLWFRSVAPDFGDNDAASIFAAVLGAAVLCTLGIGRWSDRADRPILPLVLGAAAASAGLFIMALAETLPAAILGYSVFGLFSGVFLALHSSQTLRVLPAPRNRGRDLGLFNLTNTIPSLIMPWLTLAMVPVYGFDALFILLALLALGAAALLWQRPSN